MSFYDRYALCCQQKGISPVSQAAADAIGCTKATISAFAKNSTTPRGDIVAGAAKMLDVSADYLLGLTDDPHPIELKQDLTKDEKAAVSILRDLNEEGIEAAMAMLIGLHAQDIYKKNSAPAESKKEA